MTSRLQERHMLQLSEDVVGTPHSVALSWSPEASVRTGCVNMARGDAYLCNVSRSLSQCEANPRQSGRFVSPLLINAGIVKVHLHVKVLDRASSLCVGTGQGSQSNRNILGCLSVTVFPALTCPSRLGGCRWGSRLEYTNTRGKLIWSSQLFSSLTHS